MNIDPKFKEWIDDSSYEELLFKWRFAPSGSRYFQGETGDYYAKVMLRKHDELPPGEAAASSKRIGWNK